MDGAVRRDTAPLRGSADFPRRRRESRKRIRPICLPSACAATTINALGFFVSTVASDERTERVVLHARLPANKGSTSDDFSPKISTWVAMHRTSRLRGMGSGKTEPWGFNPIHISRQAQSLVHQLTVPVWEGRDRKFLSLSFTRFGPPKRRIAPKAASRFKERVRKLTSRTRGVNVERMAEELGRYLRGWIGYFGQCQTPSVLQSLEEWTRRRLRSVIWKQWKHSPVRFVELRKRGVDQELAAKTAGSSHGPWRLANSPGLHLALPNAYFDSLGIPRLTGGR